MRYSVIIPIRDRDHHLVLTAPRIERVMTESGIPASDIEFIIAEQTDEELFRIGGLYNIASRWASGDVFIFNQVDYYPESASYSMRKGDGPFLPAHRALFVDSTTLEPLTLDMVPPGYRKFHEQIDATFHGGVVEMFREDFEKVNGFNPIYRGWGLEDEDFRYRLEHYGIPATRGNGFFLALSHPDNGDRGTNFDGDPEKSLAFRFGGGVLRKWRNFLDIGIGAVTAKVETIPPRLDLGVTGLGAWLSISEMEVYGS